MEGYNMRKITKRVSCYFVAAFILFSVLGMASSSEVKDELGSPLGLFTHGVLAEELTATWCGFCPNAAEALWNIYDSNDYQDEFYYVAMITDVNDKADERAFTDYNIPGTPTIQFDGGYRTEVGAGDPVSAEAEYRPHIEDSGARVVPELEIVINAYDVGPALIEITVNVTNHETSGYSGHLRTYITEIVSRYNTYDGFPYHFGFLDYAFDEDISIGAGSHWQNTITWNGSEHTDSLGNDFGDVVMNNIQIIASVFNDDPHPKVYSSFPNAYIAYYVDQTSAALVTNPPIYGVDVNPSFQSHTISAGQTTSYSFSITNTGNTDDEFFLVLSGPYSSWGTLNPTSITLPPGGSGSFFLEVNVPPGTTNGDYEIFVTAQSFGDPSKQKTVSALTVVNNPPTYGVSLSANITGITVFPGESANYTITVKNVGDTSDVIDLITYGPYSAWGILSHYTVSLAPGASQDIILRVDVPSDALEGDYPITVRGTSQGDNLKYSEVTLTTTVEPIIYDVTILCNQSSKSSRPNQQLDYLITVINSGNVHDTIDLSKSGPYSSWGVLSENSVSLGAGASQDITLTVSVPSDAQGGDYIINAKGTSQGNLTKFCELNFTTTVVPWVYDVYVFSVEPTKDVRPGNSIVFDVTIENRGDTNDTINITFSGDGSIWGTLSQDSVYLGPSSSQTIILTMDVPSDALGGDYMITVTGTSFGNKTIYDDVLLTMTVVPFIYDVKLSSDTTQQTTRPGYASVYNVTVENTGNTNDTMDLFLSGPYSSWGNLDQSTVFLQPGQTVEVTLGVDVPSDAQGGDYIIAVRGTCQGNSSNFDEMDFITTVEPWVYDVYLSSDEPEKSVRPGNSIEFNITIENKGDNYDTINLTMSGDGSQWGTFSHESVFLNPSTSQIIILTMDVPMDAQGKDYNVDVMGTSQGNLSVHHEISLKTTVIPYVYEVNLDSEEPHKVTKPGKTISFNITVENLGDNHDIINLTKGGGEVQWGTLSQDSIALSPGNSQIITLTVTVPDEAQGGDYEILIKGISQQDPQEYSEITITTEVDPWEYEVNLFSDITSKTTFVGTSITHTMKVENNGEIQDLINLKISGSESDWGILSQDSVLLMPGSDETITLTLNIPNDAPSGNIETIIKGVSLGDSSKFCELVFTTTVKSYIFDLDLSPENQYVIMNPGDYDEYSISVENTGNTQETINLEISGSKADWVVLDMDEITLKDGTYEDVIINIIVPAKTTPGSYTITIKGVINEDPTIFDSVKIKITVSEPSPTTDDIVISEVNYRPDNPTKDDIITITATVIGEDIDSIELEYYNGTTKPISLTMFSQRNDQYSVDIGPLDPGEYNFVIKVKDSDSNIHNSEKYHLNIERISPNDKDGDGVDNDNDAFPYDPTQTTDYDGDGYGDNPDGNDPDSFPYDSTRWDTSQLSEENEWNESGFTIIMILILIAILAITLIMIWIIKKPRNRGES
jgi:uncharacterized membrane protein